jgi:hypothetical protein
LIGSRCPCRAFEEMAQEYWSWGWLANADPWLDSSGIMHIARLSLTANRWRK